MLVTECMRIRRFLFTLLAGLCVSAAQPADAASPTATVEALFARANSVLQSADPVQGIEAPRQAIRDLVNEAFDFGEDRKSTRLNSSHT